MTSHLLFPVSVTEMNVQKNLLNMNGDEKRNGAVINELVLNSSIEFSSKKIEEIAKSKELLPYGMKVYVPSLPGRSLLSTLHLLKSLTDAGFSPVPHIAARRVSTRAELQKFLQEVVMNYGVNQVLLVGGDTDKPLGPYIDSSSILKEGILTDAGIRHVGIAGYPEGHDRILMQELKNAMLVKLALIRDAKLSPHIVTQFSFAPAKIIDYCAKLARIAPEVPVYVGMAGPTKPAALLRYAKLCGVSTSLRALGSLGFKAVQLINQTEPDQQLNAIANYCHGRKTCNIAGLHIFSFGGFVESGRWINQYYNFYSNEQYVEKNL